MTWNFLIVPPLHQMSWLWTFMPAKWSHIQTKWKHFKHTHKQDYLAGAPCHWYSPSGLCHTAETALSTAAWSPTVLRSQTRPFDPTVSCQTCLTGKTNHSALSTNKTKSLFFGNPCRTEHKCEVYSLHALSKPIVHHRGSSPCFIEKTHTGVTHFSLW